MKAKITVIVELQNTEKGDQNAESLATLLEAGLGRLIPGRYKPKVTASLEWIEE